MFVEEQSFISSNSIYLICNLYYKRLEVKVGLLSILPNNNHGHYKSVFTVRGIPSVNVKFFSDPSSPEPITAGCWLLAGEVESGE